MENGKLTAEDLVQEAYEDSLYVFRLASQAFSAVQVAYRGRVINDDEFLRGRKIYHLAQLAADNAEEVYINAMKKFRD